MTIQSIATAIDLAALSFAFGATVWFFFVQSPVLLRRLGRDAFVPVQMRLTLVLFQALALSTLVSLAASSVLAPLDSFVVASSGMAAFGAWVNKFVIVPRALRAGGQTRKQVHGRDHEASTLAFADHGVGRGTRFFHRLVVLFVLVMLAGLACHASALLSL